MITKSRKELVERVIANLLFIDQHKAANGPFEVTQLLSSFLLTLHLNWDVIEPQWSHLPSLGINWPPLEQEGLQQPRQAIGKMRDALAHGLIAFEDDGHGEIALVHMWTCSNKKTVDWSARLSIDDIRAMLDCFIKVAQIRDDMPMPKDVDDLC